MHQLAASRLKKRSCLFLLLWLLLSLFSAGCGTEEEKINVIPGPGAANNSSLVGFNELCAGTVEGFLGKSDRLLVSRKEDRGYGFIDIDPATGEENTVYSVTMPGKDYSLEISSDGSRIICSNLLVDLQSGQTKPLPEIDMAPYSRPDGFPVLPSFSFVGENEPVLSNPFYYIRKYSSVSYMFLGMEEPAAAPGFDGFRTLNLPEVAYLKNPVLLVDELKHIFVGYREETGETPLYVLDFVTKQFTLIDGDVAAYSLSPDRQKIAYIRKDGDTPAVSRLYTANLDGSEKRLLLSLESIKGVAWSGHSSWIAYSGGEGGRHDIGILRADGSGNEQLTYGMSAAEKLAWSYSGNKLAFTSSAEQADSEPKVYIITLNAPSSEMYAPAAVTDPQRKKMALQLLEMLRKETNQLLSRSTAKKGVK